MNAFKKNLHIWITSASLLALLTGWGFLAHAAKPGETQVTVNGNTQTVIANSPYQALQNFLTFEPPARNRRSSNRIRTGGS
ncbi:MAG: hypothetical protein WCK35_17490 [Chloroflexota bacterium]